MGSQPHGSTPAQLDTSRTSGSQRQLPPAPAIPLAHASPPDGSAPVAKPAVRVAIAPRRPTSATRPVGILRPHDPPEIYGVSISPSSAGAGAVVSGSVSTSSNVASVVASVAGITSGVPKVGVGQFAMSYQLPGVIPPFVKGSYTIVVIARNVDGVSTSRGVGFTLR